MKLLVLAGGKGSRLKPELPDTPKALAPIGGVPFLALQLENWVSQGCHSFIFLLHYQAGPIIEFLDQAKVGLLKGCTVDYLVEPSPLDTGGAVALAVQKFNLNGDILVANADTWLGKGIESLYVVKSPTLAVTHLGDTGRYGQVQFNQQQLITDFCEKGDGSLPGWVSAGICRLNASLFKGWDGARFSLESELFPELVKRGELNALTLSTDFIDIGVPEDYHRFIRWISSERNNTL